MSKTTIKSLAFVVAATASSVALAQLGLGGGGALQVGGAVRTVNNVQPMLQKTTQNVDIGARGAAGADANATHNAPVTHGDAVSGVAKGAVAGTAGANGHAVHGTSGSTHGDAVSGIAHGASGTTTNQAADVAGTAGGTIDHATVTGAHATKGGMDKKAATKPAAKNAGHDKHEHPKKQEKQGKSGISGNAKADVGVSASGSMQGS